MITWYQSRDKSLDSIPDSSDQQGAHAVLAGRVRSRRAVTDEAGHSASVMVLEIGGRGGAREEDGVRNDSDGKGQETYLTMLLLSGQDAEWAQSRVLDPGEAPPEAGMTLVIDGATRVCDLVRYASGVLRKGE